MTIFVFSDSHGDRVSLRRLLETGWERYGTADWYLHCGDGARDMDSIAPLIYDRNEKAEIAQVRGNCDFFGDYPDDETLDISGCRILMTHGHHYSVKTTLSYLNDAARDRGCQIALFGHTHEPLMEMRSALLLNPGAVQDGRMLVLEISLDGRPRVHMLHLD